MWEYGDEIVVGSKLVICCVYPDRCSTKRQERNNLINYDMDGWNHLTCPIILNRKHIRTDDEGLFIHVYMYI